METRNLMTDKENGVSAINDAFKVLMGGLEKEELFYIPVDQIRPNRYQPRQFFNEQSIKNFAETLKEAGKPEAIIVRINPDKDSPFRFELVAGERRLRATILAGFKTIPVSIRDYDDYKLRKVALLENIQREDLTCYEIMMAIKGFKDVLSTVEEIATEIKKKKRTVYEYLKIYADISSMPDVFEIVQNNQEKYDKVLLERLSEIIPELKKYQKHDKRELERFLNKTKKDGLAEAVAKVERKIKKSNGDNSSETHIEKDKFTKAFKENAKTFSLNILIKKEDVLSDEDIESIKMAVTSFKNKLADLIGSKMQ